MREEKFSILDRFGIISRYGNGWSLELNLVAWHDQPAKYDIREWSPDYKRMSRGLSLATTEMANLLKSYNLWTKNNGIEDVRTTTLIALDDVVPVRICAQIGALNDWNDYDFRKEVNIVSWNNGFPMVDIRAWSKDHRRMSRGLKLTQAQADKMCRLAGLPSTV